MKFLVFIFSLTLTLNANAGLISTETDQTSYNTNDIVTVDIFLNDVNPVLDFLEFDLSFDDSQLVFLDNSWFDSLEVFNFGAFGDAFSLNANTLIVQAFLLEGITDVVGTSFKLGELQFTALTNITTPLFSEAIVTAIDANFNDVDPQMMISEPSTIALFSLMAGLFLMRKRKQA